MALEVAGYAALWFTGAASFFRVWCHRGGKFFTPGMRAERRWNAEHTCWQNVDVTGWFVAGWNEGDPWYTMQDAMLLSFFFWIPVTAIVTVRETVLLLARMGRSIFKLALPPKMRTEPTSLVRTNDPFMRAALHEVETIAPEEISNVPAVINKC